MLFVKILKTVPFSFYAFSVFKVFQAFLYPTYKEE